MDKRVELPNDNTILDMLKSGMKTIEITHRCRIKSRHK